MGDVEQIGKITRSKCFLCNQNAAFNWEIPNFDSYIEENALYTSPDFEVLNSIWRLAVCPNRAVHVNKKTVERFSLYVCNVSGKIPESFQMHLGVKPSNDRIHVKRQRLGKKNMTLGWNKFMEQTRTELLGKDSVPYGTLTVSCSIIDEQNIFNRSEKLVDDLKEMFRAKKNADVVFKINGDTISANKAILSARSSVFAAMFENDMQEKQTGVVNISDCDVKSFSVLLYYMYTGEADFTKCHVFDLYKVADKYSILELMVMCLDFIILNLSIENLFETFVFSKEIDNGRLMKITQKFFNENFEKIVNSDNWSSLLTEDPDLANELLKIMAPKIQLKPE